MVKFAPVPDWPGRVRSGGRPRKYTDLLAEVANGQVVRVAVESANARHLATSIRTAARRDGLAIQVHRTPDGQALYIRLRPAGVA